MTKIQNLKIESVKGNPSNPRTVNEAKMKQLVRSIQSFPEMLWKRPIIVNKDMIVLGGNMRLKAAREAGLKEIPAIVAEDWTEQEEREFIIKDNVGYGDWDWDLIKQDWDSEMLEGWGIEVPQIDTSELDLTGLFDEDSEEESEIESKSTVILEFVAEDYEKVCEAFGKLSGSKEKIVMEFLGL